MDVSNRREKLGLNFKFAMIKIIVFALFLDILAFTIILPLFPRLADYYLKSLGFITSLRTWFGLEKRYDTVLLGGLLGSLFSFLQFLSSPVIGRLSDKYGRRTTLLLTMVC